MKILIFGGTGFLGKYLVKELAPIASKLYVVTRNINSHVFANFSNVELIAGDITDAEVIKDSNIKKKVLDECDIMIHAAALYDLKATYEDLYLQNLVGTQNVLQFLKKSSRLKAFYYVSTIAVADEQNYSIDEISLPERTEFNDDYSKTKYYAEKLVREFFVHKKDLPVRIIRPGIIVGNSVTGEIININGPYYFLEVLKKYKHLLNKMKRFPLSYNPESQLQIIPVDHVALFISLLIKRDNYSQELKTFHLISIDPPTMQTFIDDICLSLEIKTTFYPIAANKIIKLMLPYFDVPKQIIPFMFSRISYDKTLTLKEIPELQSSKYAEFKKIF